MISDKALAKFVATMVLMKFFPAGDMERAVLAEAIEDFVETDEQLEWLRRQAHKLHDDWPGVRELRAIFCQRFKPKDGYSISSARLDGVQQEKNEHQKQIEAANLPPGKVTADKGIEAALEIAVRLNSLRNARISGPATPEEIAAAPAWLRELEGYE